MQKSIDHTENSCREQTATETVQTSDASNCRRLTKSYEFNEQNTTVELEHSSDIIVDNIKEPCDVFKISLDEQVKYFF